MELTEASVLRSTSVVIGVAGPWFLRRDGRRGQFEDKGAGTADVAENRWETERIEREA